MEMTPVPEVTTRLNPSWIDGFLNYTEGKPSPSIFRKWAAISAIAGALERKCWVITARTALYPNMFIVLVSPPAVGKSVSINEVYDLWNTTGVVNLASQSVTKASLIDELVKAGKSVKFEGEKEFYRYHALTVCSSEFGVLLTKNDTEFMNTLNHLYDCPHLYSESRRTKDLVIAVDNPHLNLLAGTQPGYLSEILPELAWRMGFTSRIIMVYSGHAVKPNLFDTTELDHELKDSLKKDLKEIAKLSGCFAWQPEAMQFMADWYMKHADASAPKHSRLQSYNPRRHMHVMKLAMVRCASDSNDMLLTKEHLEWAIATLVETEEQMPQIFREMTASPDATIIEDLTNFIVAESMKNESRVVLKHTVYQYLSTKVPTNRIGFLMETMLQSGRLAESGDKYKIL